VGSLVKMARKSAKKNVGGKKKRRRKKMKLTLRSRKMKDEQGYSDKVGWSTAGGERLLEQQQSDEPTEIDHQCSMCGSMNRIPRPTTDKYKVRCAHPECEFEDEVGF